MNNTTYFELTITPSSEDRHFLNFLQDIVDTGFEETFIDNNPSFIVRSEENLDDIVWAIDAYAGALTQALGKTIDVETKLVEKETKDWVQEYQAHIRSVEVKPFFIHPTWEEDKKDWVNITIDPDLAFGTGSHATTYNCLKAIGSVITPNMRVIDIGTGSGVLAIGAKKLGALVDACDTDPISVMSTNKNCELNQVVLENVWEGSLHKSEGQYDVVIANIVADVLIFLARDIKHKVKDQGIVILSGIMDVYEDKVRQKYADFTQLQRIQTDEWVTFVLKKE
jgi:ribosomal protein L11 methyltransferase